MKPANKPIKRIGKEGNLDYYEVERVDDVDDIIDIKTTVHFVDEVQDETQEN